ncbi:MAG TPA: GAF domain-containing protein, partial [Thermomicrobiales bacterium]|nr:GAF domain-containing protein [Thermomicrobiales bacterium]
MIHSASMVPVGAGDETQEDPALTSGTQATTAGARTVSLLRTLNAIGRLSSTSVSEKAIADFVTTSVVDLVGGDGGGVFLLNPETNMFQLRASLGFTIADPEHVVLPAGAGIVGEAGIRRETIVAPDARDHPAYVGIPGSGEERFRSHVATPIIDFETDQLIGVLSLFSRERREFADETVEFLEALAREAAHAIVATRNRSANELELQRKITQLGTLQRVSRIIASSLDLDEVLRSIATASLEIVDASAAAVFRLPTAVQAERAESPLVVDHWVGDRRPLVDESARTQLVMQVIRTGAARITELDYVDGSNLLFCMPLRS